MHTLPFGARCITNFSSFPLRYFFNEYIEYPRYLSSISKVLWGILRYTCYSFSKAREAILEYFAILSIVVSVADLLQTNDCDPLWITRRVQYVGIIVFYFTILSFPISIQWEKEKTELREEAEDKILKNSFAINDIDFLPPFNTRLNAVSLCISSPEESLYSSTNKLSHPCSFSSARCF